MTSDRLESLKAYSMIFASIAVPILIAVFGWLVQTRLSEEGTKREYVQMALSILMDKDKQQDSELRSWAVAVMDATSPVPFGKKLRSDLSTGTVFLSMPPLQLPEALMSPPIKWEDLDYEKKDLTNEDLIVNYLENKVNCAINASQIKALQEIARILNREKNAPTPDQPKVHPP